MDALDRGMYIYRLESSIEGIGELVKKYRFKRAMVVYDACAPIDELKTSLLGSDVEFMSSAVDGNVITFSSIDEGYFRCITNKCDSVIGIGSLVALDCAKGINILRFNGGHCSKYTDSSVRRNPGSGLFCIPTVEADEQRLLHQFNVWDNKMECSFDVECYTNYYVKLDK